MNMNYRTDRLLLRVLQPEQANQVLDFYVTNKDFLEPVETTRPENFYTLTFHQKTMQQELQSFLKMQYFRYWLYLLDDYSAPIGSVSFNSFQQGYFSSCMVGYKLSKHACHQGYMTEALDRLLPQVHSSCKVKRIEAMILPSNQASIALAERLSFVKEGYLHSFAQINGRYEDHLLYTHLDE